MAQMKEQHRNKADIWDSFTIPWRGKFARKRLKSLSPEVLVVGLLLDAGICRWWSQLMELIALFVVK